MDRIMLGQADADVPNLGLIAKAFGIPASVLMARAEEAVGDDPDDPMERHMQGPPDLR